VKLARTSTVVAALAALAAWPVLGAPPPVAAAGEFTLSPTTLSFPATYVGATSSIAVVVTNVSGSAQSPNFSGGAPLDQANFGGSQNCAGKTFAPGDTCTFTYEFTPTAEGQLSSSTTIGVGSDNFSISMSGTGLFPFTVAPTTLTFPTTAVGSTSSLPLLITNISPASQSPNFSGGAPLDPANFGGSQNCAGKTFAPGDTCTFTYEFTPTATGPLSTTTTIGVDAENFAISLSGVGDDGTGTTTTTTTNPTGTADADDDATTTSTATTLGAGEDGSETSAGSVAIVDGPLNAGHAQVIAQGIVDFPLGSFSWSHEAIGGATWPYAYSAAPPQFVAVDGPDAVLVAGETGSLALLDEGEALFLPAGSTGSASPMFDGAVSAGRRITFVPAAGESTFSPGAGRRDVNLIRDVLAPDDSLIVSSPFPVLLVVVDGAVTLGDGTSLEAGGSAMLATVDLRNDGDSDAVVLVAAVGGPVP
jgi:hypothetical protein